MAGRNRIRLLLLQNAPWLLFLALVVVFGLLSGRFLTPTWAESHMTVNTSGLRPATS